MIDGGKGDMGFAIEFYFAPSRDDDKTAHVRNLVARELENEAHIIIIVTVNTL